MQYWKVIDVTLNFHRNTMELQKTYLNSNKYDRLLDTFLDELCTRSDTQYSTDKAAIF